MSDEQAEFQITDRISFMRFLNLDFQDKVPDARTIWHFRDVLVQQDVIEDLFDTFKALLDRERIIAHAGSLVDASFADVPKQHNNRDENDSLKGGIVPKEWSKSKRIHKDTDARMAKKRDEYHYGYKNHIVVDSVSKIITMFCTTPANVPDFRAISKLIPGMDNDLWADSAYNLKPVHEQLMKHGIEPHILKGNTKGHRISDADRLENTVKSQVRVRVEHVFGFMKSTMNGINRRCVGIKRNTFNIGLCNLLYNMCRYTYLKQAKG